MKNRLARLRRHLNRLPAYAGQCSICQGWFEDWPGGVCAACQATGRT